MASTVNQTSPDRPAPALRRALAFALGLGWMRLRFVAAVAALFLVIVLWRHMGGYWDQTLAWFSGTPAHEGGVSPDTEYFCPMCPGVLSAWPEKCPVCKMPLVRRAIGSAQLLPEGVTARMQVSPYRLQLGGIKTSPIGYLPLEREIRLAGHLSRDGQGLFAVVPVNPWDAPQIATGMRCEVLVEATPADIVLNGRVEQVSPDKDSQAASEVKLRIDSAEPIEGKTATITVRIPVAELEPFRQQPRDPPPLHSGEPRQYFVCPSHSEWIRASAGKCPFDGIELEARALRPDQRLQWSCGLHGLERCAERGQACPHCERGCHVPRVVDYAPRGQVLAIPESAVIDNGRWKVVYVQTMPGMFDGVEVKLGRAQGGYFPVLSGLSPGERVATSGAFLLDAETRLNPALAASYFGAGSVAASAEARPIALGSPAGEERPADRLTGLQLSADELALARRQGVCPITRLPLGSMGELVRVEVEGQPIFLCCAACRGKIRPESLSSPPVAPVSEGPRP